MPAAPTTQYNFAPLMIKKNPATVFFNLPMINCFRLSTQECTDRSTMDRQRLEMAHLKYAILNVCQWYSPHLSVKEVKTVPGKIDDTISVFTSVYYSCFSSRYASKLLPV